ncbi:MAG TPA: SPOR domain-containing protein [Bacteroidales bacterium]|nr:SPOR domain-containing protein [Bacteroidales bacterium]
MQPFLTIYGYVIALILTMVPGITYAQDVPEYDEISIFVNIPLVGGTEMPAVIKGQELYLPVTDLFDFLKIRNTPAAGLTSVSGFFINQDAKYNISRTDNRITYQDKTYNLNPGDLIRTESNLYLKTNYYGKIFGLDCEFNFRSLSATIKSKLELPLIREMRLEEMRKNLTRLKGEVRADTTIDRTYPLFRFGMADWSAISTQEIGGQADTRLSLALGAMLAKGEATANLYYNSTEGLNEKQQYYRWRYVNNDFKPLRQVMAGKIAPEAISSIYNPVVGVQLTNTPTTYRRSFGTYTLSDRTEPGWIVELYINNVLVDYVKADASGFFSFEVPLVYGNSTVRLKFYGPWGEERTREQNITIPFNFLPVKTMEYNVSAGIIEDSLASRFTRAGFNYGLSRSITVGGGVEYLSSISSQPAMPFINASLRVTNNILLSGEFDYGVRAKGTFTYRLPSNIQLDLNYTWYDKDQKAISYNYREERKAVLSLPIKIGGFRSYHRFSIYQIILPSSNQYTTAEWLFSGSLYGINTSLTTYGLFPDHSNPYVYSNLSLSTRLPGGFILMPQAQYSYSDNEFISAKVTLQKHFFGHAYLDASYEQLFRSRIQMAELGLKYDFSFAQAGASVRRTNNKTSLSQYARGSIISDRKTKYITADNRTNVGKGGITVIPFLDINNNGKRDRGEPKASGLNLHANGGRVIQSERDTTIRIIGLEPYTNCFIELDPNSFDNISWRLKKLTMSVAVDPEILKEIDVPVAVKGEASGNITFDSDGNRRGLGRMIVNFLDENSIVKGRTLSEGDGYFNYFGLAPGNYSVKIDTAQLSKLNMVAEPISRSFEVKSGIEGDVIIGLNFTVTNRSDTSAKKQVVREKPAVKKDTSVLIVHEVTQELVTIDEDSYAIQLGAFKVKGNAERLRASLVKVLGREIDIVIENGFYKVRINDIKDRDEVDRLIDILHNNGINELWVISLKAKKKQWILKETKDTVTTITERKVAGFRPEVSLQLGAFKFESNALAVQDQLAAGLNRKIEIVREGGYYKVRISGVPITDKSVLEEMERLQPEIGKLGLKDVWVVPVKPQLEAAPVLPETVQPVLPVVYNMEVPQVSTPVKHYPLVEENTVVSEVPVQSTYSLQVGVYLKRSDALRAQRRIVSKLDLPVEIVKVWDYYHVLITGFSNREETFQYYPELAGLGFRSISLIEKK